MSLFARNSSCVPQDSCPTVSCSSCASGYTCQETVYSCNACASVACIAPSKGSSGSKGTGVSPGVIAAAVIVSLLFLVSAIVFFWWYRRRNRAIKAAADARVFKEVTADTEDVLRRPDPHEKAQQLAAQRTPTLPVTSSDQHVTSNVVSIPQQRTLHPYAVASHENPFEDSQSIRTTSAETQSTNVIPIALVPPGSVSRVPSTAAATTGSVTSPPRPERTPGLDADLVIKPPSGASFNLEHTNVSNDSFSKGAQDVALRAPGDRSSYMTTGTFASDVLAESPMIVTANKVLSVSKPEFIQVTSPTTLTGNRNTLQPPGFPRGARTLPARSPLAQAAFNASDASTGSVVEEDEEGQEVVIRHSPFGDEHSPSRGTDNPDNASVMTFGSNLPSQYTGTPNERLETDAARPESEWVPKEPHQPWSNNNGDNRSSVYTNASSLVAELGSATRVNFGLTSPNIRSPNRLTAARIVGTPDNAKLSALPGPLVEQQQRAFALAKQAQAKAGRRISDASAVSATADSILESFTFVPPSPISATPPRSPNKPTQTFRAQQAMTSHGEGGSSSAPSGSQANAQADPPLSPLLPPSRHKLALSTVSQSSALSNGLGEYAFQIGTDSQPTDSTEAHPQSVGDKLGPDGKHRASLDTLALTNDLSAYPLAFDRQREASWNDMVAQQKQ